MLHIDINECAGNIDDCAQVCNNTDGSFQCSCNSGYSLSSNGRSCLKDSIQGGTENMLTVTLFNATQTIEEDSQATNTSVSGEVYIMIL